MHHHQMVRVVDAFIFIFHTQRIRRSLVQVPRVSSASEGNAAAGTLMIVRKVAPAVIHLDQAADVALEHVEAHALANAQTRRHQSLADDEGVRDGDEGAAETELDEGELVLLEKFWIAHILDQSRRQMRDLREGRHDDLLGGGRGGGQQFCGDGGRRGRRISRGARTDTNTT